jgi:hypothetical protein
LWRLPLRVARARAILSSSPSSLRHHEEDEEANRPSTAAVRNDDHSGADA